MIYYLPLEPYQERYTYQLALWTLKRFDDREVDYEVVDGQRLPGADHIRKSVALDPHGRSYYGLTQMAELVKLLDTEITSNDVIYMQDLYQPGYDVLPYIIQQSESKPKIVTHLLAQSIDPNDFTFPMRYWMRHYEFMVDKTADVIMLASSCMVDMMRAAMFDCRTEVVGLPFDKYQVREMVGAIGPLHTRTKRVVFTSRCDREKQPLFFVQFARKLKALHPEYQFAILTGQPALRSNEESILCGVKEASMQGVVDIYEGLTKQEYYEILADSVLQFNCALQDFVSNTLNEASALGTPSLLPAYLSFPEAVNNERRQLYVPWSLDDAVEQAQRIIESPPLDVLSYSADKQHETLDNVIDILLELQGLC